MFYLYNVVRNQNIKRSTSYCVYKSCISIFLSLVVTVQLVCLVHVTVQLVYLVHVRVQLVYLVHVRVQLVYLVHITWSILINIIDISWLTYFNYRWEFIVFICGNLIKAKISTCTNFWIPTGIPWKFPNHLGPGLHRKIVHWQDNSRDMEQFDFKVIPIRYFLWRLWNLYYISGKNIRTFSVSKRIISKFQNIWIPTLVNAIEDSQNFTPALHFPAKQRPRWRNILSNVKYY